MTWSWLVFFAGFVAAFLVSAILLIAWWSLITLRSPKTRAEIDAEFDKVKRSVLASINSDLN